MPQLLISSLTVIFPNGFFFIACFKASESVFFVLKDIYAVNIFDGGEITDYGDYSSVEMLNTTDKINKSGDKITFSSSADRVYYKGKLTNSEIPWNISVRFFIDGKEYTAARRSFRTALAGFRTERTN